MASSWHTVSDTDYLAPHYRVGCGIELLSKWLRKYTPMLSTMTQAQYVQPACFPQKQLFDLPTPSLDEAGFPFSLKDRISRHTGAVAAQTPPLPHGCRERS